MHLQQDPQSLFTQMLLLINMFRLIRAGEEREEEAIQPSQVTEAQLQQKHNTVGRHLLGTVVIER